MYIPYIVYTSYTFLVEPQFIVEPIKFISSDNILLVVIILIIGIF